MSQQRYTQEEELLPPDAEIDTGEPIQMLSALRVEPDTQFLDRIRARIDRMETSNQFLAVAWYGPQIVVLEFLALVFELFQSPDDEGGSR